MSSENDQKFETAVIQEIDGDAEGAIQALRLLLGVNPNYSLAHNALSAMYNRQGKVDQAIEHAKRYCELEPEDAFGYTVLSSLCVKVGRREEAEEALMNAQQQQMRAYMKSKQIEESEE